MRSHVYATILPFPRPPLSGRSLRGLAPNARSRSSPATTRSRSPRCALPGEWSPRHARRQSTLAIQRSERERKVVGRPRVFIDREPAEARHAAHARVPTSMSTCARRLPRLAPSPSWRATTSLYLSACRATSSQTRPNKPSSATCRPRGRLLMSAWSRASGRRLCRSSLEALPLRRLRAPSRRHSLALSLVSP